MEPVEGAARATRRWWTTFARRDVGEASPVLAAMALRVADDDALLARVEALAPGRRQPNLVLGAARYLGAPEQPEPFARWLAARWDDVAAVAGRRTTQTNEAGRCATLLPLLAELDGPLALLEVGASAGLCLAPDRYSYAYRSDDGTTARLDPDDGPSAVLLTCRVPDLDVAPMRLPQVVWRAGLDLNPLDPADPDDVAWLRALVWPGQDERRRRLADAAAVVARLGVPVHRGDLGEDLAALAASAPPGARLVVLHSAVLAYVPVEARRRFVAAVRDLDAVWLSNEGRAVLPDVTADLPGADDGRFVLCRDGVPRALTDQHGASYTPL